MQLAIVLTRQLYIKIERLLLTIFNFIVLARKGLSVRNRTGFFDTLYSCIVKL